MLAGGGELELAARIRRHRRKVQLARDEKLLGVDVGQEGLAGRDIGLDLGKLDAGCRGGDDVGACADLLEGVLALLVGFRAQNLNRFTFQLCHGKQ